MPFGSFDHAVVDVPGVHTWHAFAGFTVPAGYRTPLMKQSDTQLPELQTWPEPHALPFGSFDHAVVDVPGVHTWHALVGFTVPAA